MHEILKLSIPIVLILLIYFLYSQGPFFRYEYLLNLLENTKKAENKQNLLRKIIKNGNLFTEINLENLILFEKSDKYLKKLYLRTLRNNYEINYYLPDSYNYIIIILSILIYLKIKNYQKKIIKKIIKKKLFFY